MANETDLRRAVSDTYYALFHFTLVAAVDMVLGSSARSSTLYALVYRSVEHVRLRALCANVSASKPQVPFVPAGGFGEIAKFASIVANLYEQRNLADYDPSQTYTANKALWISDAREAIKWFQGSTQEQQQAFLTLLLLLFKPRP